MLDPAAEEIQQSACKKAMKANYRWWGSYQRRMKITNNSFDATSTVVQVLNHGNKGRER